MPDYDDNDYEELSSGIRISREYLDEELIKQPNSFFHVSEGHVINVARRDKKKHDLEIEIANLDKLIREEFDEQEKKSTEKLVEQELKRDKGYQHAYNQYLDASLKADKWAALKEAYRQRADMLKALVTLHSTGYFGEITGAAERRDARDRFAKKQE